MKIIVMGTGPFAVPTFQWLLSSTHEIPLLVTRPIGDSGKRRKTAANPMRDLAEGTGLPVFDPANVNTDDAVAEIRAQEPDLLMVCDYGQILSRDCLATAKKGGINLHGSLLPKYRGAAPVHWAIYNGDKETGVTVIHMTAALDAGPNLVQRTIPIGDEETTTELEERLSHVGVEAVEEAITMLQQWDGSSEIGVIQEKSAVTKAPRLHKSMGRIDWSLSAVQIKNQIRAFQPWPGCFSNWISEQGKPLRLIIHRAKVDDITPNVPQEFQRPGTVVDVSDNGIQIATGQGTLVLLTVQPAGKREMDVAEFLRGRKVQPGDRFGDE